MLPSAQWCAFIHRNAGKREALAQRLSRELRPPQVERPRVDRLRLDREQWDGCHDRRTREDRAGSLVAPENRAGCGERLGAGLPLRPRRQTRRPVWIRPERMPERDEERRDAGGYDRPSHPANARRRQPREARHPSKCNFAERHSCKETDQGRQRRDPSARAALRESGRQACSPLPERRGQATTTRIPAMPSVTERGGPGRASQAPRTRPMSR